MSLAGRPVSDARATERAPAAAPADHTRVAGAIRVRAATMDDLETVVRLRLALVRESSRNAIFGRVRADAGARARDLYATQLAGDREVTLLAIRGDAAVGILRCVETAGSPLLVPARYCYIGSAYVIPRERRRGVLRRLLAAADRWCVSRGLTEMRLHHIAESEVASETWRALGFDVTEVVRLRRLPGPST